VTEAQMLALLAASLPLPPPARTPFLEHCAPELANVSGLGDGILHRTIMCVQKLYSDPPDVALPLRQRCGWQRWQPFATMWL
jgi:hypothetical protein